MNKKITGLLGALSLSIFSSIAFADTNCEMPPGIDEGDTYWIFFRGESKTYKYKINDVDDCWIEISSSGSKDRYWYQIDDIRNISSEEVKD